MNIQDITLDTEMDKREALKFIGSAAVAGIFLANFPVLRVSAQESTPTSAPDLEQFILIEPKGEESLKILVGEEREVEGALSNYNWAPDSQSSFVSLPNGDKILTFTSGRDTIRCVLPKGSTNLEESYGHVKIATPTENLFEEGFNDYFGVSSTILTSDNQLIQFAHLEKHYDQNNSWPFNAAIAALVTDLNSEDGRTIVQKTPVIRGNMEDYKEPSLESPTVNGAGQPWAILDGDTVFVLYTKWDNGPDTIYASSVNVNDVLDPAKYNHFESPVMMPSEGENYNALISAYKHPTLGWIGMYEENLGFSLVKLSFDKVNGVKMTQKLGRIHDTPTPMSQRQGNLKWTGYGTLMDLSRNSSQEIGNSAELVYAKGSFSGGHRMYRKKVIFGVE